MAGAVAAALDELVARGVESVAIYKADPVFIFGQAGGLMVYARNLYFIHRDRVRAAGTAA